MIDLIVPTVEGREASLERCLASFEKHTDADLNEIIVRDSITCGWGWKTGLERSEAPYVLLACDDQECIGPNWAQIAMETVDEGFLPCPRVWLRGGQIESQGGDMNAFRHVISRPQKDRTPVDYTVIPFLSREQIDAIGMLPTQYAGDTWVSYRGRQLGYETILRHGYDFLHYHEQVGRGAGMSQEDRDKMDCETVFKELERLETA